MHPYISPQPQVSGSECREISKIAHHRLHGALHSDLIGPNSIGTILKRAAIRAGIDAANIAGHSMRAGMATQVAMNASRSTILPKLRAISRAASLAAISGPGSYSPRTRRRISACKPDRQFTPGNWESHESTQSVFLTDNFPEANCAQKRRDCKFPLLPEGNSTNRADSCTKGGLAKCK